MAKENDILVGISTSGNSKNIIKAFEISNKMNPTIIWSLSKKLRDGTFTKSEQDPSSIPFNSKNPGILNND